jgi:hypothetical protein
MLPQAPGRPLPPISPAAFQVTSAAIVAAALVMSDYVSEIIQELHLSAGSG